MAEIVCKVRRLNSVVSAKLAREITQNPRPGHPCKYRFYRWGKNIGYPWTGLQTAEILC